MKAWELLEKPGAWTQGVPARDMAGRPVPINWYAACCWCAYGAICRSDDNNRLSKIGRVEKHLGIKGIADNVGVQQNRKRQARKEGGVI